MTPSSCRLTGDGQSILAIVNAEIERKREELQTLRHKLLLTTTEKDAYARALVDMQEKHRQANQKFGDLKSEMNKLALQ